MDTESVREDLGYMNYEIDKSMTFNRHENSKRIEYLNGIEEGKIRRGVAREV